MVLSCSAYGCTNRNIKGSGAFHRFPKDLQMQKQWVLATKRSNFTPTNASRLCSDHFTDEDYLDFHITKKRVYLRKGAVPSIFNFPKSQQRHIIKRKTKNSSLSTRVVNAIEDTTVVSKLVEIPITTARSSISDVLDCQASTSQQIVRQDVCENSEHQLQSRKRKHRHKFVGDYNECDMENVTKAKQFFSAAQNAVKNSRRKMLVYQQKCRRLQRRCNTLASILDHLKNTNRITPDTHSVLQECVPRSIQQLLLRSMKVCTEKKFPPELRVFALTLQFYSNSAYEYVRKTFCNFLPHPSTLRKWYSSVDGSPGFTYEAIRALQIKVKEHKEKNQNLIGALIMDEMTIRQQVEWKGTKSTGYINYGTGFEGNDALPMAKEALVFLFVALNDRWKVPVGYFLTSSLTATDKSSLVQGCLKMIHDTGAEVVSLTFDGAANNLSMANILGANLYWPNIRTAFSHPITGKPIHIFLDPCHMLKLVRNTLGDWSILQNGSDELIEWKYFKLLVDMQEEAGLHAATKLRRRHLNFDKEKMKVSLAAQTLSASVADALLYCKSDLNLRNFANCKATSEFCRMMDGLFDILNSRNCLSKSLYCRPLNPRNENDLISFLNSAFEYLSSLKTNDGVNILYSQRKTGFLGFLVCIKSVLNLYNYLVKDSKQMSFLLTYKMSQDHIEMFFSSIRARGGFNNNPTASQFESAYKRLLIHSEISSSKSANCLAQDETSILHITSTSSKKPLPLDLLQETNDDVDYQTETVMLPENNLYIQDIVAYISGFIARKVSKLINCQTCAAALVQDLSLSHLIRRKSRGGLFKPTKDVITVCKVAETVFREVSDFSRVQINNLIVESSGRLNIRTLFVTLQEHILEQDAMNNHLLQLIYHILYRYFLIRIHHRNTSLIDTKTRLRKKFTKLIHFYHQ